MAYIVLTFFLFTISCFGQYSNPTITTEGDAQILVAPDQVEIVAGIETNEVALADARNENAKRARAILAAAKKLGVADGDSKTDFFRVEPNYKQDNIGGTMHSIGPPIRYWVRSNVSILLKDPSKYEELLVAILDAGATHIHRTAFSTTQLKKYRDQARDLAVKAAIQKAKDLVASAGLQIDPKPINISVRGVWDTSSYGYWGGGGPNEYMSQNRVTASEAPGAGSVSLGRISVSAAVSLTFKLIQ